MAKHDPEDRGFLSRWSTRKRDAQQSNSPVEQPDENLSGELTSGASASGQETAEAAVGEAAFNPDDLPDIETLDKDSDFSVFMSEKVPEALRRRALRRLWRVDPSFAFLDGMNDYDEDYTDAALVVEGLKTVYQVGKGMVIDEQTDESEDAEAQSSVAHESEPEKPSALEAEATGADRAAEGAAEGADDTLPATPDPEQGRRESTGVGPGDDTAEATWARAEDRETRRAERVATTAKQVPRKSAGGARRRRWGDHSG